MLSFVGVMSQRQVVDCSGHSGELVDECFSAIPDIRLPACLGQQCNGYLPFGHVSR